MIRKILLMFYLTVVAIALVACANATGTNETTEKIPDETTVGTVDTEDMADTADTTADDVNNDINLADVKAAFEDYLDATLGEDAEYTYGVNLDSTRGCVILVYTLYYGNDNNFEVHWFEAEYSDGRLDFVCEYDIVCDSDVKYESNTPEWRVETANHKVVNEASSFSHILYTINLYGPNGEEYTYYEYLNFPEGLYDAVSGVAITDENSLGFAEYEDARFDRKLVVHPNYDYALLVFPAARETSAEAARTKIQLINLKTGELVETPSAISALYDTYDDWREGMYEIDEYNEALGYSLRTVTEDVEITDTGYHITAYLHEWNGDIMRSAEFDIDLEAISNSFDSTYGLEFSFVRNGGMFYLIYGDNDEIVLPDTESELYALVIDGCFVPVLPEKGEEGILVPAKAFEMMNIEVESEAKCFTLDELAALGYTVDTVSIDKNSILNYELNAIVIETRDMDAMYTVEKAQGMIYERLRGQYDKLLSQIDSGELALTHTENCIEQIVGDAAEFTVESVRYKADFGRYYVFTASVFGAEIYFNKYTGEIYSDSPVIEMATVYINRGLYDLGRAYW